LKVSTGSSPRPPGSREQPPRSQFLKILVPLFALLAVGFIMVGPIVPGRIPPDERESPAMQTARIIELALFQYAQDHKGLYPSGRSSTEVFQKLVDGNYVSDPSIFWLKMKGKNRATSNHLEPENIGFDVTEGMTDHSPDMVPGVFATGYLVEYKPGGHAIPLVDRARPVVCRDGLPVAYHNNDTYYRTTLDRAGVVTNAVPIDADLGPGPYTQLTPDGPVTGK
jgi:hypothetical protein